MWSYSGQRRPDFAVEPGPGQESVWDYPRPPALVPCSRRVEVSAADRLIAVSRRTVRILETASPPTFYLPPEDVDWSLLDAVAGSSFCEWKGRAGYFALRGRQSVVAWSYPEPTPEFAAIAGYVSFYPGRVRCTVDGETVRPQPGDFYGGWVTEDVVGPFKGEPGTGHW